MMALRIIKRSRASAGNTLPGHFTMPLGGTMQLNPTDTARSKEELVLDLVREGRVTIDAEGRIWKHWRWRTSAIKEIYDKPLRADFADKLGYCRANFHVGKRQYIVYAHRLVWIYHNGTIPDGLEVNHKNGVKSDNRIENLELVTHSANASHAYHSLGKHRHIHTAEFRKKLTDAIKRPVQTVGGVLHYQCTKCETWKPVTDFGKLHSKRTLCGVMSSCRKCSSADRRKYRR